MSAGRPNVFSTLAYAWLERGIDLIDAGTPKVDEIPQLLLSRRNLDNAQNGVRDFLRIADTGGKRRVDCFACRISIIASWRCSTASALQPGKRVKLFLLGTASALPHDLVGSRLYRCNVSSDAFSFAAGGAAEKIIVLPSISFCVVDSSRISLLAPDVAFRIVQGAARWLLFLLHGCFSPMSPRAMILRAVTEVLFSKSYCKDISSFRSGQDTLLGEGDN